MKLIISNCVWGTRFSAIKFRLIAIKKKQRTTCDGKSALTIDTDESLFSFCVRDRFILFVTDSNIHFILEFQMNKRKMCIICFRIDFDFNTFSIGERNDEQKAEDIHTHADRLCEGCPAVSIRFRCEIRSPRVVIK